MIAIIPARGGSKGLPKKNIKKFGGIPLIAHTIKAAKESSVVSEIILSTDSEEIKIIGEKYGATCPFLRPDYLALDDSLAIENYKYTLNRLEKEYNRKITNFMVLQPTSPLRTSNDINLAHNLFVNKNADSVLSFVEESHPVFWHKYIDDNKQLKTIFADSLKNRQGYQKTYYPNGAIFIFNKKIIFQNKYITDNSYAYLMPRKRSIDIDTIDDFEYAEFILGKGL